MNRIIKFLYILVISLWLIPASFAQHDVIPETALQSYLKNGDNTFGWKVKKTFKIGNVQVHDLELISQQWREHKWVHQLAIFVPEKTVHSHAVLMIHAGDIKDGQPVWIEMKENGHAAELAKMAEDNNIVTAMVRQTPNQPLYGDLYEDALISLTLSNLLKDGDYSWPLLFPMVKTAVRSMDAITQFTSSEKHQAVDKFIVTGASKRGWTTWLTGSQDKRVVAIAPMVIDILNIGVSIPYQMKAFGAFSSDIRDYEDLGLLQLANTDIGQQVINMIDPYSYRDKITIPKFIILANNDQYWVTDNVKNYYDGLTGEKMIHYVPNAKHNMNGGRSALNAVNGFASTIIAGKELPECEWDVEVENGKVHLSSKTKDHQIVGAEVWSATSSKHDFRESEWTVKQIPVKGSNKAEYEETLPQSGYRAFYINFKHIAPNEIQYTTSTRVFITNADGVL